MKHLHSKLDDRLWKRIQLIVWIDAQIGNEKVWEQVRTPLRMPIPEGIIQLNTKL